MFKRITIVFILLAGSINGPVAYAEDRALPRAVVDACKKQAAEHGFKTSAEVADFVTECGQDMLSKKSITKSADEKPEKFPDEPTGN